MYSYLYYNYLPDISGRVTALVPKGITGECLNVLLLSWNALDVGEPNTANGPVNSGEDALLFPVERRNGDVPLEVCECLATGLTCHVFGGGGVSLNLKITSVINLNNNTYIIL